MVYPHAVSTVLYQTHTITPSHTRMVMDCGSGQICDPGQSNEDCWERLKEYKFYLSFENSACKDYVTEKFYRNALAHAMVPVVLGLQPMDVSVNKPAKREFQTWYSQQVMKQLEGKDVDDLEAVELTPIECQS